MLEKVSLFVKKYHMIEQGDRVVLGLSGGADSVCLFFLLLLLQKQKQFSIYVVHVNHLIREKGAVEDQRFVEQLCEEYKIPFCIVRKDVRALAKEEKLTEEEAGRKVRYKAFYDALNQFHANKIAVAHHKNDQAETVLFHLFRGSGLRGIGGMLPVRGNIIRPLLCVTRKEIESYLRQESIAFQTDQSNFETEYTRNKIRLKLLSYITKEINEKAIEHISETANIVREAEEYLESQADIVFQRIVFQKKRQYFLKIESLLQEAPIIQKIVIKRILCLCYNKETFQGNHVQSIIGLMGNDTGKEVHLPEGIVVKKQYDTVKFEMRNEIEEIRNTEVLEKIITPPMELYLERENIELSFSVMEVGEQKVLLEREKIEEECKNFIIIPKNNCTKWFDYDKMLNTVMLRNRREGDFLQIDQQGGHKKLKRYFIDLKIPKEERDQKVLLADGNHIIWILGGRISEAYKISEQTKRILIVEMKRGKKSD